MRNHIIAAAILSLGLGGCTTSSRIDALDVSQPSMESTASVSKRPVPPADVTVAQIIAEPDVREPNADIEAAMSQSAPMETEAVQTALMIVPKAEPEAMQVAMIRPSKPRVDEQEVGAGRVHGPKFRDAKPIRFGRISPKQYAVHGVDVSRWQGNINWSKLRSHGANFAFIKATDGGDHLDPAFRRNWNGAAAAGVKRGAYHFFYWCRPAESQARWFIRHVPRVAGALPPVIDVEWVRSRSCTKRPSPATVRKKMQVFMDMLEAHYGQRPIIYTAPDFYEDNLQGAFQNYPFWLRAVAEHPSKVYPGRKWVFWQYSGTGLSKGVGEKIDLNVFAGDAAQWARWAR